MRLLVDLADEASKATSSASVSGSQLVILAGGVTAAAAIAGGISWLLNSHYRSSRGRNNEGKLTGTRKIDVTFARVAALLSIAALGTIGLGMSIVVDADLVSAYFTLLGTIAGYLIGAKAGTAQTTEQQTNSAGDVVGTTEVQTPTLG